ncbi:MAG: hypothetical protein E3J72_15050 [Planctomycetota bacterium]|nr:MAG: hypothetical protein E3J72_15050 [Planctomycetota bacterium]
MKPIRLSLVMLGCVVGAAFLSGCVSADAVGHSPEKDAITAERPWAIIPPAAYHKIFPDAASAERESDVRVNVNYRDKVEEFTLTPGKHIDSILLKMSTSQDISAKTFAWVALVKISVEYGPIAIVSSVREYQDSAKSMDSILIENGDGILLLRESEFKDVAKCISRMFATRKTIPPPENKEEF